MRRMFVLKEIDNILRNLSPVEGQKATRDLRISLDDIGPINIDELQVSSKVQYKTDNCFNINLDQKRAKDNLDFFDQYTLRIKQPSLDSIFYSQVGQAILSRLSKLNERQYPSARIIICDEFSHAMLMKLHRISSFSPHGNSGSSRTSLYRPPYNVTAIIQLTDIIEEFEREREPILLKSIDRSSGKQILSYNYPLIRKNLPFLKMSDLILLLSEKVGSNEQKNYTGSKLLLQFLNHFARSAQVVQIDFFNRILGKMHLYYNNVLMIETSATNHSMSLYVSPSIPDLSQFADRLVQMADMLKLYPISISYRANDIRGHSKLFAKFVSTLLESKKELKEGRPTRVLVIDRFHDIASPLYHADLYGPFLEQEYRSRFLAGKILEPRIDTLDKLDEELQLCQLTEVLNTILKYSISIRKGENSEAGRQTMNRNVSFWSDLLASRSIRRHLDLTKDVYRCLTEGYLLVLRLESTLYSLNNEMRSLKGPLNKDQQKEVREKFERLFSAFKKLTKVSGSSITVADIERISCILIDTANTFLFINREDKNNIDLKFVRNIKDSILECKEFFTALDLTRVDSKDKSRDLDESKRKIASFDKLSSENCDQKSVIPLETIVRKFRLNELESDLFPEIIIKKDHRTRNGQKDFVILAFLGLMTSHELSQLKMTEITSADGKIQVDNDIIFITTGLTAPNLMV